jgi:hypothetical protein
MMFRDIKAEDHEDIISLYKRGYGSLTVAKKLMIRPTQVMYFLKKAGIMRSYKQSKIVEIKRRYNHLPEWMR